MAVEPDPDPPYKIYATACFAIVFVLVGVPLWWKTTEVYRASLPTARIQDLASRRLKLPIAIRILYHKSDQKDLVQTCADILWTDLQDLEVHPRIKLDFTVDADILTDEQLTYLFDTAKHYRDLDLFPMDYRPTLDLAVDFVLTPEKLLDGKEGFFARGPAVFVRNTSVGVRQLLEEELASILLRAIRDVFIDVSALERAVVRATKERPMKHETESPELHDEKTGRVFEAIPKPKQALDFYLVNPSPDHCDSRQVNMREFLELQLGPFFDLLRIVSNITVGSQKLYYVDLLTTNPEYLPEQKHHILKDSSLPHLITPIEKYTTTLEETTSVYRFVIYLTPPERNPLLIVDSKQEKNAIHNGFAIASWGGVTIWNDVNMCNKTLETIPPDVMDAVSGQLKEILGLSHQSGEFPSNFAKSTSPISVWELHRLGFRANLDYILSAIGTLASLVKLLDQIQNIVISDHVAADIQTSVDALDSALTAIAVEDDYVAALGHSRQALIRAESAFFDPSLLSLLYFPDDQKYAIYIPLFVPVGIPVLMSLITLLKFFLKHRRGLGTSAAAAATEPTGHGETKTAGSNDGDSITAALRNRSDKKSDTARKRR